MKIRRAASLGFCSGVRLAEKRLRRFAAAGGKGEILGQVVHNERVVEEMEDLGYRTVGSLSEARSGAVVFSAHGVAPSVHREARRRGYRILDTTCPFVYEIHDESRKALEEGAHLVFLGDPEHREVMGYTRDVPADRYHVLSTLSQAREIAWDRYPEVRIFYQTTLNAEDYEEVAHYIEAAANNASRADTVCLATRENQEAAVDLAKDPGLDLILVVGGRKSANTRHLWEICRSFKPCHLVHSPGDLESEWFQGVRGVGITAGASTPDVLIDEVESEVRKLCGEPRR